MISSNLIKAYAQSILGAVILWISILSDFGRANDTYALILMLISAIIFIFIWKK